MVKRLQGLTLQSIERSDDKIVFRVNDSLAYKMLHDQDCCECVLIDDICGDLEDLVGSPIVQAEEATSGTDMNPLVSSKDLTWEALNRDFDSPNEYDGSQTWTFYKIGTNKGSVTIRWYGTSNGYYSESVDFREVGKDRWDD